MKQNLLVTFTSPDRPGIVELITSAVVSQGGNWEESRLARLCGDFAGMARISVSSERAELLIRKLKNLEVDGLHIAVKQTVDPAAGLKNCRVGTLSCAGADHEGIVNRIATFLARQGINVDELETSIVPAPTTGTPIFEMNCRLSIPSQLKSEVLHSDLQELAGELAVDISMDVAGQ